jgi:hypothetical protein
VNTCFPDYLVTPGEVLEEYLVLEIALVVLYILEAILNGCIRKIKHGLLKNA